MGSRLYHVGEAGVHHPPHELRYDRLVNMSSSSETNAAGNRGGMKVVSDQNE
jgi:hypothetical protein